MKAETAQTQQSVQQLEDDVSAAQKLSSQLDPKEIERLLAPVDRLKVATLLEHQGHRVAHAELSPTRLRRNRN